MSTQDNDMDEGRRRFMVSGSLFVAFSLLPEVNALAQEVIADEGAAVHVAKETEALAGSLKTNPLLDAWIKITPGGKVTVFTGKVELGTGVRTALLQIAAEELNMAPSLITFLTADTGLSPDEGLTAGSHTIADSGSALLNAAAQVRGLLVDAAAKRLGVDGALLNVRDAKITAPDGRAVTYGEAVQPQCNPNLAVERSEDLQSDRHVDAASRYPRQAHRRRQLRSGHAHAEHGARAGRASARL